MSHEVPSEVAQNYSNKTLQFVQRAREGWIHTFVLAEHFHDEPTDFWGYFSLFPILPLGSRPFYIAFSITEDRDLRPYRSQMLSWKIPDRVRRLGTIPNSTLSLALQTRCATFGLPSIVLAVGNNERTLEEVITLLCVNGMTPREALNKIQNRARQAIARTN